MRRSRRQVYITHCYMRVSSSAAFEAQLRVGRWGSRFAICAAIPGLCRDSSSAVVPETRMVRRATFDLLVELGPRVRRPRALEPGRAHRRRLGLRCMHARCASPASRSFKPWVRVPMPRQETRKGTAQCFRGGGYLQMSATARRRGSAPSWSRTLFVDAQCSRTRWIEVFGGMGEQSPRTTHAPRRAQPAQSPPF